MRSITLWVLGVVLLPGLAWGQPAPAQDGVTADTILIGRTAGLTGPIAERMKPQTDAINAYFDAVNAAGGVNGRKLKVIHTDDGFDAKRTAENTKKLLAEDKVFTMFAAAGGPMTAAMLPLLAEYQVPLVGTTAGADNFRVANKYLFHLKASYGDEFGKIAEHLKTTGVTRVTVVFSEEGTGRDGRLRAEAALAKNGIKPGGAFGFKPGEAKAAIDQMVKTDPQAIILTTAAGPGAEFYKEFVKLPNRPQVFTWSIMVVEGVYKAVGEKAYGLVVAQIVPSPNDKTFGVSRDYQALLKKNNLPEGSYSGMEGYIAARVLVEGLKRAGKALTREKLIAALEGMHDFDLGGEMVNFTGPEHVGRRQVELTIVGRDGKFLR